MDTVILDGRYSELDFSTPLYTRLTSMLREQSAQLAELPLRSLDIQPCLGCFNCWVRTPGECIQVRGGQQVAQAYMHANLVVFFTPVAFGGYSSVLKKAVDHLIPNISPFFARVNGETHHHRRYQRYPALLVVGVLPAPDARSAAIFRQLAERNSRNFYPPSMQCAVLSPGMSAADWQDQVGQFYSPQEVLA